MEFTPVILSHTVAASAALVIGGLTLAARKGTRMHRMAGRFWVGLMLFTAIISFWIRRNGEFSVIHILSIAAIVGVLAAIAAAARGNIRAHRGGMLGVYISLAVAGVFTLLPNRRLGALVWGGLGLI